MFKFILEGGHRLDGTIAISGSKNATLPLMAAALLADSPTILRNVPELRDIRTMISVIESLGVKIELNDGIMKIDPAEFYNTEAPYDMVRKMRASVYVMGPMLAKLGKATVSLPGGCAIGPRPIDLHLKGFENLGATVSLSQGNIIASVDDKLKGKTFDLAGTSGSSVGATCNTLMAAVLAEGTTVITSAATEPDVSELVNFLIKMGANIEGIGTTTLTIHGVNSLEGIVHTVVTDRIEAGTFMIAAGITHGYLKLLNVPFEHMESTISKLREIGLVIKKESDYIEVYGDANTFSPVMTTTAVFPGFPTDMQAQLTALLSTVKGTSIVRETIYPDRFMHVPELLRLGANINVMSPTATIQGVDHLCGAPIMASDLRASAALVLAGLAAEGTTTIRRIYHIDRGYESIETKLKNAGAVISRVQDEHSF
ncbi:MAG: UDP-N-acetylglucosamine 1-carboxyvinyltransferase [Candidatus Sumerlaeales bacterium]|nr:UDP-N-acetylglucosamine 1-carboxyvinyltransferase [Candidatus Sumerlaeales bacterium]